MENEMSKFFELTAEQIKAIYEAGKENNFETAMEIVQASLNEGKSIYSNEYIHLNEVETLIG